MSLECRISPPWNIFSPVASSLCVGSLESEKQPPYHLLSLCLSLCPLQPYPCHVILLIHSILPVRMIFVKSFGKLEFNYFFFYNYVAQRSTYLVYGGYCCNFIKLSILGRQNYVILMCVTHIGELLDFFFLNESKWRVEKRKNSSR